MGCKKFVTIPPPPTSLNSGNVYTTDGTAASVMTQLYGQFVADGYGVGGVTELDGVFLFAGLYSDEITLEYTDDNNSLAYYTNSLTSITGYANGPWNEVYNFIYTTNAVLEGVTGNAALTPAVVQQLQGEAKFMRGMFYFYLVNMYGDVPLVTNTAGKANALLARTPMDSVYSQVIADLKDAQNLLSDSYLGPDLQTVTTQKVRPTKSAATALLSRVYLYRHDYADAYAQATALIQDGRFKLDSLNGVFLMNSNEAIWQLQNVVLGIEPNTPEGNDFIIPSTGFSGYSFEYYLNNALVNSFEPGDKRRQDWIDSVILGGVTYYYPYKYKNGVSQMSTQTENQMVFRLGEQYLIRSEAQANGAGGGLTGAVTDLNVIRERAGLPDYAGQVSSDSIMAALLRERRSELFTEWGHRWFDLKRWPGTTLSDVMIPAAAAKGAVWNPDNHQALFPLWQQELLADPNMTQTPGY